MLKRKTKRSPQYLDYIRSLPCCVTGTDQNIIAHHVRIGTGGGTSLKPSDYFCLPLNSLEHQKLHKLGEAYYFGDRGINPHDEICELLFRFKMGTVEPLIIAKALEAVDE